MNIPLFHLILDSAVQLARIFETTENAEKHKDSSLRIFAFFVVPEGNSTAVFRLIVSLDSLDSPD